MLPEARVEKQGRQQDGLSKVNISGKVPQKVVSDLIPQGDKESLPGQT